MDWACLHARKRNYPFWKSFTTGKSPLLGGIPHDVYGMTTRSIHKYVTETLKKIGLDESKITKFQTGGPDGDLGSNEILISKDRTISIVDGAGVIYDPEGLDRAELTRLAKERLMISHFDTNKLSKGGFRVLVTDKDIELPNGERVEAGLTFRNEFHLNPLSTADLFVPCGGRPESINIKNVKKMFKEDGVTPRFKIIVEGANLFLTQDARLVLEKAGVVLFKDASANKGGVTSSSLEVLAALSMSDEEFKEHMQVRKDGAIPEFYKRYVQQVQQKVEENALLEFECIWNENVRSGTPRSVLTDVLSTKINGISEYITASKWTDDVIKYSLRQSIPSTLIDLVGINNILKRVPQGYLNAIVGACLSSRYIYKYGISSSELSFYQFMHTLLQPQKQN